MKTCITCGEKDQSKFYASQHNNYCKICWSDVTAERFRANKRRMVEYLGGSCKLCGYNQFIEALEVHHLDPSLKIRTKGSIRSRGWKKTRKELETCILLCSNCHAAVEAGHLAPLA